MRVRWSGFSQSYGIIILSSSLTDFTSHTLHPREDKTREEVFLFWEKVRKRMREKSERLRKKREIERKERD